MNVDPRVMNVPRHVDVHACGLDIKDFFIIIIITLNEKSGLFLCTFDDANEDSFEYIPCTVLLYFHDGYIQ